MSHGDRRHELRNFAHAQRGESHNRHWTMCYIVGNEPLVRRNSIGDAMCIWRNGKFPVNYKENNSTEKSRHEQEVGESPIASCIREENKSRAPLQQVEIQHLLTLEKRGIVQ